jgi:ABC-type branched-subunit amino acid transport system substrate-binding protein
MTILTPRRGGLLSRRAMLKGSLVAGTGLGALSLDGIAPLHFVRDAWADDQPIGNYPKATSGATVTLGFNVPLTGPYAEEGKDELKALQLAVQHLNGEGDGGMVATLSPKALKGNGILGKKVAYASGDTQTKADVARASAKQMVEKNGAIMITGGSSSAEAVAVQALCQEMGIIFMAGLTHSNDTTGKDRRRYGFRHFFDAYMSGKALGPILAANYGKDRVAYHLTADYTWGWTQEQSMKKATEAQGWKTVAAVRTPLGAPDFSQYITPVLSSGADVLILNHYGGDMVHSLTQAVQFGLRNKTANGKQFEIVVPLFSELMAQGAGPAIKGIFGTANWDWKLDNPATKTFTKSFGQAYGTPPSQAAQTCYVQALLYANAVETAGTFYPPAVIKALEGFKFDGLGNGPTEYRAADHQCFKDVLVVRGKEKPANQFDLLEIVKIVPRADVEYDPNDPAFNPDGKADLGPYVPA